MKLENQYTNSERVSAGTLRGPSAAGAPGRSVRLGRRQGVVTGRRTGKGRVFAVAVLAIVMATLSTSAEAAPVGSTSVRLGVDADFGDGEHVLHNPGVGKISWDYTPVGDVVRVNARVKGTLYLDRVGSGCARLRVIFVDAAGDVSSEQRVQFCGPGFNANDPQNQRPVDIDFTSPLVRRVQLVVGSGPSLGQIVDDAAFGVFAPGIRGASVVNNGSADLGGGTVHLGGSPQASPDLRIGLTDDGSMKGTVRGTLFWDSTTAGCATVQLDFKNKSGANLSTQAVTECGPDGGNALAASNRTTFTRSFTAASLHKIRIRVGRSVNGSLVGAVASQTRGYPG